MAVLVKDGQSAEVGQPLIQIDPLEATEGARSAQAQAQARKVQLQLEWPLAELRQPRHPTCPKPRLSWRGAWWQTSSAQEAVQAACRDSSTREPGGTAWPDDFSGRNPARRPTRMAASSLKSRPARWLSPEPTRLACTRVRRGARAARERCEGLSSHWTDAAEVLDAASEVESYQFSRRRAPNVGEAEPNRRKIGTSLPRPIPTKRICNHR